MHGFIDHPVAGFIQRKKDVLDVQAFFQPALGEVLGEGFAGRAEGVEHFDGRDSAAGLGRMQQHAVFVVRGGKRTTIAHRFGVGGLERQEQGQQGEDEHAAFRKVDEPTPPGKAVRHLRLGVARQQPGDQQAQARTQRRGDGRQLQRRDQSEKRRLELLLPLFPGTHRADTMVQTRLMNLCSIFLMKQKETTFHWIVQMTPGNP